MTCYVCDICSNKCCMGNPVYMTLGFTNTTNICTNCVITTLQTIKLIG